MLSLVGLSAPDSDDHLVKRIIGTPGDHVVCCNALGQITVNGVPIDETDYLKLAERRQPAHPQTPSTSTVPEDSLWVLGDNRDSLAGLALQPGAARARASSRSTTSSDARS